MNTAVQTVGQFGGQPRQVAPEPDEKVLRRLSFSQLVRIIRRRSGPGYPPYLPPLIEYIP